MSRKRQAKAIKVRGFARNERAPAERRSAPRGRLEDREGYPSASPKRPSTATVAADVLAAEAALALASPLDPEPRFTIRAGEIHGVHWVRCWARLQRTVGNEDAALRADKAATEMEAWCRSHQAPAE